MVQGVEPHGIAVGPYEPRKKYGIPGFPYGTSKTQCFGVAVPAGPDAHVKGRIVIV